VQVMTDADRIKVALATIDEALATHVVYEYRMMKHSVVVLAREAPESLVHILALEAFLLHYRNLLHFLKPPGRVESTDLLARRYIGKDVAVSEEHRKGLHRWLAHLTTDRLAVFDGYRKKWPVWEMVCLLEEAWSNFVEQL